MPSLGARNANNSLTEEARLIRVLMVVQRGEYTETDTKRAAIAMFGPRRISMAVFQNILKIQVWQKTHLK